MAKTGERYVTARRALTEQHRSQGGRRSRIAEPETTDDAVRAATGKNWDEWCDIIDARPDRSDDHTSIAAYLIDDLGVDPWWGQTITVGYERISGLRLPYQRPDGTFTAGKTATVAVEAELLRALLLSDDGRADLFPGFETELRSRQTSKAIRIAIGGGLAQISLEARDGGRSRVAVAHERLAAFEDVEPWKTYWTEWLEAIDGAP